MVGWDESPCMEPSRTRSATSLSILGAAIRRSFGEKNFLPPISRTKPRYLLRLAVANADILKPTDILARFKQIGVYYENARH